MSRRESPAIDPEAELTGARPIQSILVGVELADQDGPVLDHAAALAERHGASLRLLHVVEWLEAWWRPMKLDPDFLDRLGREGRQRLEDAFSGCAAKPPAVEFEIGFGTAWQVLLDLLERLPVDLVVLGSRGRHGARKRILGTTAERVVTRSSVPVLTIPGETGARLETARRVLVPTDLSLDFEEPLREAVRLCGSSGGGSDLEIILLHAVELPHRYDVHIDSWGEFVQGAVETIREHVEEGAEELSANGLTTQPFIAVGDPADVILTAARDRDVDLIALNNRGGTPKRPLYFGSTARQVVRDAPCPVLTVPSPE